MANICSNWLTILSEDKKEYVHKLFKELVVKQHKTNERQCFDVNDIRYMDNIYVDDDDSISYETDWASNFNDLVVLAYRHKFDFKLEYEELGCNYFGFVVYDHEKNDVHTYHLNEDLMKLVKENKHGDYYLVDKNNKIRGEVNFDSLTEYYQFLLEEQYKLGHT